MEGHTEELGAAREIGQQMRVIGDRINEELLTNHRNRRRRNYFALASAMIVVFGAAVYLSLARNLSSSSSSTPQFAYAIPVVPR